MEIENRQQQMPQYYDNYGKFLGYDGKESDRSYISMPTGVNDDGTVDNGVFRIGHDNVDDWQAAYQQQMFDWSLAQYNNMWNSPVNQVKLLKEAGLNPNVFNGSSNSTAASSSPQQATNTAAPGTREMMEKQMLLDNLLSTGDFIAGSLDKAFSMKMGQQQLDNEYERLKLEGEQIDLERQRVNNESRQTDSNVIKQDAETRSIQKNIDLMDSDIQLKKSQKNLSDRQAKAIDDDFREKVRLNDATISRIAKQNEVDDATVREINQKISDMILNQDLTHSQINLNGAQFDLIRTQDRGFQIRNDLDEKYAESDRIAALNKVVFEVVNLMYTEGGFASYHSSQPDPDKIKGQGAIMNSLPFNQGSSRALPSTYNYNGISYPGRLNGNFGSRVFGR